jgi:hypothetical protein
MLMMEVVVWGGTGEFITLIPTLIDELGCIPGIAITVPMWL